MKPQRTSDLASARSAHERLQQRPGSTTRPPDHPKQARSAQYDNRLSNPLARHARREQQPQENVQKIVHRIEIKFLFPESVKDFVKRIVSFLRPKALVRKIGTKKIIFVIAAIIVVSIGYTMYKQLLNRPIEVTQDLGGGVKKSTIIQKPNYDTVLPYGKTIEQLGGWTRVSPPDRNPVFAYTDTIGKAAINVSQQPIPKDARSNDDFVSTLAKSYLANDKVTAGETTFYVGTSAKGPQSVIFAKGKTLVLIRSSVKINDTEWANYVSSLR